MLKLAHERPNSFLLESVEGGAARGRYSIIGCEPDLDLARVRRARRDQPRAASRPRRPSRPRRCRRLQSLRALLAESRIELPPELPPMAAGIFGYMGYDTVRLIEHLPATRPDALGVPDSILVRPTMMVDLRRGEGRDDRGDAGLSGAGRQRQGGLCARGRPAERRRASASTQPLPHAQRSRGRAPRIRSPAPTRRPPTIWPWSSAPRSTSPPATSSRWCWRSASRRPSRCRPSRSTARCGASIPRRSCSTSISAASPLVGSSPEILVRVRDGEVTIRPIAGTRPRGATPEEDKALDAELLADPKERAEHLMLLDLGRNDVGRVAEDRHGARDRELRPRALQPGDAHRRQRGGRLDPRTTPSTR